MSTLHTALNSGMYSLWTLTVFLPPQLYGVAVRVHDEYIKKTVRVHHESIPPQLYGVATISKLLKMTCLFCKRAL